MDPDALDKLLLSLIDRESKANFDLELTEPVPWEGNTSLNSKEADLLLQRARTRGYLKEIAGKATGACLGGRTSALRSMGYGDSVNGPRPGENTSPAPGITECGASGIAPCSTSSPRALPTPTSFTARGRGQRAGT